MLINENLLPSYDWTNVKNNPVIAGIDTGGTFTDTIVIDKNKISVIKIPSTPEDPSKAVLQSVNQVDNVEEILHGTTVATNAVIERKGAKVVLITTKGFADVIEIGRQNRDNIYALYPTRPTPLVSQENRIEVDERILATGEVEKEISTQELDKLQNKLSALDFESIAICTLFSFLNPIHEQRIVNFLTKQMLDSNYTKPLISVSSQLLPEYREYERTSTTVMDAYIKPLVSRYLEQLENKLLENESVRLFAVMKSSKGLAKGKSIATSPVHTLFSGLAAGIKSAEFTAKLLNIPDVLALDIGGTSTDVSSIINYKNQLLQHIKIDGFPVLTPSIDVETIGAGGGSLIQLIGGLLRVGPESAGAKPGPVSYGLGGVIPTVTDADLIFGILADSLAGNELQLDKKLARKALDKLAEELQLTLKESVLGARRIFHENIAAALRSVSTKRGFDPRKFTLLAFGGAGPLHACELAEILGITEVVIPPIPGAWSAMGLIGGDYEYTTSKGLVIDFDSIDIDDISSIYSGLEDKLIQDAQHDNLDLSNKYFRRELSIRFKGQSFELEIPFEGDKQSIHQAFLIKHRHVYGFAAVGEPMELVAIRLTLVIPHDDPILPEVEYTMETKNFTTRKVLGYDAPVPVYLKQNIQTNETLKGPLIIDQLDTTTFIPKNWTISIDNLGFIRVIFTEIIK